LWSSRWAAALSLDFAELVQGFLELAGELLGVHAEGGEGAVGVDDVKVDGGFELRDAVEAPGGVDEFLGELGLCGGGRLVFVEELAAVVLVSGGVLGSEDRGVAGEAVGEGIQGRTLFAGGGAGSGGEERVGAVGAIARFGSLGASAGGLGVRDWGGNQVCHRRTSDTVVAWADGVFARQVAKVVGWEGKIDEEVA
jgi:hypothetical protein